MKNISTLKKHHRRRIRYRVRKKINGNETIPRISIYKSNKHFYVQAINDKEGKTLISASTIQKKIFKDEKNLSKDGYITLLAEHISKNLLSKGIKEVVFDRSGYIYHGLIKQFADAMRQNGLKF